MFFRLFSLFSYRANSLMIALRDSPCEQIGELETCPILKGDRSLVRL
jgi:hypothetical protein